MGQKSLQRILAYLYCIKYVEMYVCNSYAQKHVSYKNNIKSTNTLRTGSYRIFGYFASDGGKFILTHLYFTKYNEIHVSFRCTKACFL